MTKQKKLLLKSLLKQYKQSLKEQYKPVTDEAVQIYNDRVQIYFGPRSELWNNVDEEDSMDMIAYLAGTLRKHIQQLDKYVKKQYRDPDMSITWSSSKFSISRPDLRIYLDLSYAVKERKQILEKIIYEGIQQIFSDYPKY